MSKLPDLLRRRTLVTAGVANDSHSARCGKVERSSNISLIVIQAISLASKHDDVGSRTSQSMYMKPSHLVSGALVVGKRLRQNVNGVPALGNMRKIMRYDRWVRISSLRYSNIGRMRQVCVFGATTGWGERAARGTGGDE